MTSATGKRFGDYLQEMSRDFPIGLLSGSERLGSSHRYYLTEPPTLAEVAARVRNTPDEAVFERMLTGNMRDLVQEYFESDLIRAAHIDAQGCGGSRIAWQYHGCGLLQSYDVQR